MSNARYRNMVNGELDAESPATSALAFAYRDNPVALYEKRIYVIKQDTEHRTATTTLALDDELVFNILAGEVWWVKLLVYYTSTANSGFKAQFYAPSMTGFFSQSTRNTADADAKCIQETQVAVNVNFYSTAAVTQKLYVEGYVSNDRTDDVTVGLTWAQNTSHADNTTVYLGSYIIAHRMSAL